MRRYLVLSFLLAVCSAWAQVPVDSLRIVDGGIALPFLSDTMFEQKRLLPVDPFRKDKISEPTLGVRFETGYNRGDWSYGAVDGWYHRVAIDKALKVGKLPFDIRLDAPLDKMHDPLKDQFSSFGFDYRSYLQGVKAKALDDLEKKKEALLQQHFNVPNVKDSLALLSKYETAFKSFSQDYTRLRLSGVESLPGIDSAGVIAYRDSLEKTYTRIGDRYNRLATYREQYQEAKVVHGRALRQLDSSIHALRTGKFTPALRSKINEQTGGNVETNDKLKAFDVGAYGLSVSPMSVYGQQLRGLRYEGNPTGLYAHAAVGGAFQPNSFTSFRRRSGFSFIKQVAFVEAGLGDTEEAHNHVFGSYAQYVDGPLMSNRSLVFGVTRKDILGKRIQFKSTLAKALFANAYSVGDEHASDNFLRSSAAELAITASFKKIQLEHRASAAGPQFVNHASTVQQTNQFINRVKATSSWKRFSASAYYQHSRPVVKYDAFYLTQNSFGGLIKFKVHKRINVVALHNSHRMASSALASDGQYRSSFSNTSLGLVARSRLLTLEHDYAVTYTRNASTFDGRSTVYHQVQIDETIAVGREQTLSASVLLYSQPDGSSQALDQQNATLTYGIGRGKFYVTSGLQFLKNHYLESNLFGGIATAAYELKTLQLSIQCDYKCDRVLDPRRTSLFSRLTISYRL